METKGYTDARVYKNQTAENHSPDNRTERPIGKYYTWNGYKFWAGRTRCLNLTNPHDNARSSSEIYVVAEQKLKTTVNEIKMDGDLATIETPGGVWICRYRLAKIGPDVKDQFTKCRNSAQAAPQIPAQ